MFNESNRFFVEADDRVDDDIQKDREFNGVSSNLRQIEEECSQLRTKRDKLLAQQAIKLHRIRNFDQLANKYQESFVYSNEIMSSISNIDRVIKNVEEDIEFASKLVDRLNRFNHNKTLLKVRLDLSKTPSTFNKWEPHPRKEAFLSPSETVKWQTSDLSSIEELKKEVSDLLSTVHSQQREYNSSLRETRKSYKNLCEKVQRKRRNFDCDCEQNK